ncbi:MAG: hypothetical protein WCL39_05550 [Armatimonadota bacterium]|jgi:hypothetical protein
MATMLRKNDKLERCFYVVHPLDDIPEEKFDAENLGPMQMTKSVRWSLIALRAYLIMMGALVGYHTLDLAGLFGHYLH